MDKKENHNSAMEATHENVPAGRDDFSHFSRLLEMDSARIGWPESLPALEKVKHGWFRPGNRELIERLFNRTKFLPKGYSSIRDYPDSPKVVVELGSWLGLSTEFILNTCPTATVIAVDLWENDYFLEDSHYNKNDAKFATILKQHSIYDQFLNNLREYKYHEQQPSSSRESEVKEDDEDKSEPPLRLIPMKMDSSEALKLIAAAGIVPDCIYIDASHHYDFVCSDIAMCVKLFPQAVLVGDDYDNTDVRRAVDDMTKKLGKELYVRQWGAQERTCWTFAKEVIEEIDRYEAEKNQEQEHQKKKLKTMHSSKFADVLKMYGKK